MLPMVLTQEKTNVPAQSTLDGVVVFFTSAVIRGVQKHNIYTNVPSSQTFRSYLLLSV
jgi:hypothetical protein